jgi:hypothetical protein
MADAFVPRPYIVMTSSAHMPTVVRARYINVAVVEVTTNAVPKMISPRARGVRRIISHSGPVHLGSHPKGGTAAELALSEAETLASYLNGIAWGAR